MQQAYVSNCLQKTRVDDSLFFVSNALDGSAFMIDEDISESDETSDKSAEAADESPAAPDDSPAAPDESSETPEESPEASDESLEAVDESLEAAVSSDASPATLETVATDNDVKRARRFGEVLGHTLASMHSTLAQRGIAHDKAEELSKHLTSSLTGSISSLLEGHCD